MEGEPLAPLRELFFDGQEDYWLNLVVLLLRRVVTRNNMPRLRFYRLYAGSHVYIRRSIIAAGVLSSLARVTVTPLNAAREDPPRLQERRSYPFDALHYYSSLPTQSHSPTTRPRLK